MSVSAWCIVLGAAAMVAGPRQGASGEPQSGDRVAAVAGNDDLSQAVFALDGVPRDEDSATIRAREERLADHERTFFRDLEDAIESNTLEQWVEAYVENNSPPHRRGFWRAVPLLTLTRLADDHDIPRLGPILVPKLRDANQLAVAAFLAESAKEPRHGGLPADLNTVNPSLAVLQSAIALKTLDAYEAEVEERTESFIETFIEGKCIYADGHFQTTGYNKEVFGAALSSYVAFLHADDDKFPITRQTFETFWSGITAGSYESDNSPHYEATTGLSVILEMGLMHGREDDLRNCPHYRRILTRMARTVMPNGETAKWGKSMSHDLGDGLRNEAAVGWPLKVGYRLFNDPHLLYVARKYEDRELRVNPSTSPATWPQDINASAITNVSPPPDAETVHLTERIASRTAYGGWLLGRADRDYRSVQDKLILSTGHHPLAPSMLMNLGYTQHHATHLHRIGIDNFMFRGVHLATYRRRPGHPNHTNSIFIAPDSIDYPLTDVPYTQVEPGERYKELMGFGSGDYELKSQRVGRANEFAVWGQVKYEKFQYDHVAVQREVVLLHNGILVVRDRIATTPAYDGHHNGGVVYQLWPAVARQNLDRHWALQAPHRECNHTPGMEDVRISAVFWFAAVDEDADVGLKPDPATSNHVLYATTRLKPDSTREFVSLIVPMQDPRQTERLVETIRVRSRTGAVDVSIPCGGRWIRVSFDDEQPPCSDIDAAPW